MRPLELHVRNFRSFVGETTFDFRDRRLLGIVGPIGAGKSSILDAISYALYARTPRVASAVRDLIHQRNDTAIVRLTFDVEGAMWQVTRSIRKSQSNHTLQQLDEDGGAVETVTQKTEVNQRIEELIGLDFDGFSRSVLLAQGRFAEFLNAQPAQRDRVLKGVFGHERIDQMRQVARQRSTDLSLAIEKLSGRLEALALAEQRLVEQRADHATLSERLEALEKIQPRVQDHDERLAAIAGRVGEIDKREKALLERTADLPAGEEGERVLAEAGRARTRRSELAETLDELQKTAAGAEAEVSRTASHGSALDAAADLLVKLEGVVTKHDERSVRLATAEQALGDLDVARTKATAALIEIRTAVTGAEEQLAAVSAAEATAQTTLDQVRHDNMAHTLRTDLEAGEPCPVCAQTVDALPDASALTDVDQAERDLAAARSAVTKATAAVRDAGTTLATAEAQQTASDAQQIRTQEECAALRLDVAATETERKEIGENLREVVGDGDAAELVRKGRAAISAAREAAEAARKTVERARAEHDQAIRDEQTAEKQIADLRLAAARVASALGLTFDPATDETDDLRISIDALRGSLDVERRSLGDERAKLDVEHRATATQRSELLAGHLVRGDLTQEITGLGAKTETLAEQIAAVEKDIAAQAADREALAELETRRGQFDRIVSDLTDAKFVRYLLDDERVRLGDLASDHFQRLTSGRYRFSDDGKFEIIDLATADVVRKADSLSGGETFLASLALALGLAEMVARSGGRLEAFFLDEGFGTLDPEHLHLAMEGIERLVTDGSSRLVVVVSHVPELRQRIEDLIELEKHPLTGDTVVVRA